MHAKKKTHMHVLWSSCVGCLEPIFYDWPLGIHDPSLPTHVFTKILREQKGGKKKQQDPSENGKTSSHVLRFLLSIYLFVDFFLTLIDWVYFGGPGTRTQRLQLPYSWESPLPNEFRTKNGGRPYHGSPKPCNQTLPHAICKL